MRILRLSLGNLPGWGCVILGDAGREVETSYRNQPPVVSPAAGGIVYASGSDLSVVIFCLQEVDSVACHAIYQAVLLGDAA